MVKKILVTTLSAMIMIFAPPQALAEQPAAEEYRQIFKSGNFYVEFKTESNVGSVEKAFNKALSFLGLGGSFQVLANQDGARVLREKAKSKNPHFMHKDGIYYNNFYDLADSANKTTRRMLILPEEELNSPVLEADEGWQRIRSNLALPDELAIFYWDEPYREQKSGWLEPIYIESSTLTLDKKTYDCDKYVSELKSLEGTVIAQNVYNALYENGKLAMIQKYFLRDGQEILIETLNVKNITSQIPENTFAIDKKTKIYKPRNGDMNDLLDVYEEIGGDKK